MNGPDYSGATWMPAHPSNFRTGRPDDSPAPTFIVIHCTDGHARAEGVGEMWSTPVIGNDGKPRPSSAHFCVGQDGTVIQAVRISDTAWHAHAVNGSSVGIEHCARTPHEWGPHDMGMPPSDALYASSARLVAWLCASYKIAPTRVAIVGHAEADSATTHTLCPNGCGWDWAQYMAMVAAEYEQLQTPAA